MRVFDSTEPAIEFSVWRVLKYELYLYSKISLTLQSLQKLLFNNLKHIFIYYSTFQ